MCLQLFGVSQLQSMLLWEHNYEISSNLSYHRSPRASSQAQLLGSGTKARLNTPSLEAGM